MSTAPKGYPSDVSDDEWAFAAPYLTLLREDAHQRAHDLRAVLNAVRWPVKTGAHWRYIPNDFPSWAGVYQQARRWLAAGCFEAMAHDLRDVLRVAAGRAPSPTAAVLDGRTIQSTPGSGGRAGYDGHKRRNGSKVHMAVDTLGLLLAVRVTAADEQERAQVAALAADIQAATGQAATLAYVDQGYTGAQPAADAAAHGIRLEVVKLAEAKKGFVLLPRRWVVERSFGWLARFRRLARDYERTAEVLAGWHWVAFAGLVLTRVMGLAQEPLDPGPEQALARGLLRRHVGDGQHGAGGAPERVEVRRPSAGVFVGDAVPFHVPLERPQGRDAAHRVAGPCLVLLVHDRAILFVPVVVPDPVPRLQSRSRRGSPLARQEG